MDKPIVSLVELSLMEFQIGKAVMITYPSEQKILERNHMRRKYCTAMQSVLLITIMEIPCFFPVHFP